MHRLNGKLGTLVLGVEREALRALMGHAWRGNVRELENVLERAMVMGDGDLITQKHLPADLTMADGTVQHTDLREAVRQFERQHLRNVLAETNLDKREAAQLLGISLASLYRKLNTSDN